MTPAKEAVAQFAEKMKALGVTDYIVAIRDPDDRNADHTRYNGSPFWRIGATQAIHEREMIAFGRSMMPEQ
jgi:hypothetical protein